MASQANREFGGESALTRMLAGSVIDLAAVRTYLGAELSGRDCQPP